MMNVQMQDSPSNISDLLPEAFLKFILKTTEKKKLEKAEK